MTAYLDEAVRAALSAQTSLDHSKDQPLQRTAITALPVDLAGREYQFQARAYRTIDGLEQLIVLINQPGSTPSSAIPLVRLHSGCVTGDIFHSLRCDCRQQLQSALSMIAEAPSGALVYIPYHEGRGIGLFKKIQAYALQDQGLDTIDANLAVGAPVDARDYTLACRALLDLGITEIRLLSNNPDKLQALAGFGIAVSERVPMRIEPNPHNARYLQTKRRRLAHNF